LVEPPDGWSAAGSLRKPETKCNKAIGFPHLERALRALN
jgi:hypothetical protein